MKTLIHLLVIVILFSCGPSGADMAVEQKEGQDTIDVESVESMSDSTASVPTKSHNLGYVLYYIPDTMKVGREYKIQLRISKHNTVEFHINTDTSSVKKQIRVGSSMETKLIDVSNTFSISTTNTPIQTIENDSSYTEWVWYVVPRKSGRHLLKLLIVIKENNLTKDIPVYEDKIYVQSSPLFTIKEFFTEYWQYVLGLIGSIFTWWFTNVRRKKKKSI